MAHFARLDENNVVIGVYVVVNEDMLDENGVESEYVGAQICRDIIGSGKYVQTSYNDNFRGRYAADGMIYDEDLDEFINPDD